MVAHQVHTLETQFESVGRNHNTVRLLSCCFLKRVIMKNDITKSERAFFRIAKNMSDLSDHKHKIGAAVVIKHRIVSTGVNSNTKCNAHQARLDMDMFGGLHFGKIHAETDALLPLIKNNIDLSDAAIFVYREHKNSNPAMARPCERCMKLIKSCGIKTIYYTTDDGVAIEKINYSKRGTDYEV